MTKFQFRVLNAMPDKWISVVDLTNIVYPERARYNVNALHRSKVRDAVLVLSRTGFVIRNGKGLFQPYDYSGKTSKENYEANPL